MLLNKQRLQISYAIEKLRLAGVFCFWRSMRDGLSPLLDRRAELMPVKSGENFPHGEFSPL
ncbi:hypothetical protein O3S81_24065 [Agrobacterium sp. SOY23]|uniref:hypothetical protein n=1 Tax=Agrobacterium sp. SOY23 TaxID=3014555 RepID=UPI0022B0720F|nr:hypothetical protein [Agrobacterium sp. SOY23]MCZ4432797.1 hypothetical protein [Agrobacterium sp. SOY23]